MNVRLIIRIAKALLIARLKQTLIAAIGVTFSITMFIALLSFMGGLNKLLDGLILNRTAHVRIFNEIKPNLNQPINISSTFSKSYNFIRSVKSVSNRQEIYNSGAIMQALKKDTRVKGLAPKITAQVFFNNGSVDITGIISGIDVQAESNLFHFSDYVLVGNPLDIKNVPNSIILGQGLADILKANIGDVVQITTIQQQQFSLKVTGFFQSGMKDLDKIQSYASISTTQKILGKPSNYITDIQVKLNDLTKSPMVAKEYSKLFQADAEDIQTVNAQFETGSFIRTLISYLVGITLLIVAGFGIYNILNMMIYEKMDSIAILKATGFSGADVNNIFMVIALSIGIFGGLFGLLFGFLFSLVIGQIPFVTASLPTVKTYPIDYNLAFYVIGAIFSIATTWMAGWAPARKASKIDPVIIIRGK
jgi:lipoprotein-releasing system permease protein